MRFARINLLRYGALTETALTFRPDAALHVVYGPNEAGKSSALSAFSDLLFGFPDRTDQGFFHDAKDLRIAAELTGRDDKSLTFRRRKGRKNTLLADDDKEAALSDDALIPFLGGLDRLVFERAFGLNSERLRKGADEMLEAGGEIGSLLFSAASGMMGLTKLRRSLEEDADAVYAPRRASNRSFYQALDRHEEARRAERDSELKSADWKRLVGAITNAETDLETLRKAREETRRELERLRTLGKLAPLIAEIDGEIAALCAFDDLEALPASFAQTLAEAMDKARLAAVAEEKATEELAGLKSALAALFVDEALLREAAAVTARFSEMGAYQQTSRDLPRIAAEADGFDQNLIELGRRLGLEKDVDPASVQPPETALARLRKLLEEGKALESERVGDARRLAEERDYLRSQTRKDTGALIDTGPLSERLSACRPELADLARIESLSVQRDRLAETLMENSARLRPEVRDLNALAAAPMPDEATIMRHRDRLAQLEGELRDAGKTLAQVDAERTELAQQLLALESGVEIVTREDIAAARSTRDAALADLRRGKTVPDLERQVAVADDLADRALTDADRVSRHMSLRLRAQELQAAQERAALQHEVLTERLAAEKNEYRGLFAECGVTPLAPDVMLEWRRDVERLLKERIRLQAVEDERAALKRRETALRSVLEDMAATLGLMDCDGLLLSVLHRELEQKVAALSERFLKARAREDELRKTEERIEALEARAVEMDARYAAFRARFAEACHAIGLDEHAEPVVAETALDLWREVPGLVSERDNRRRRVTGMRRDLATFEAGVATLVDALAPDLKRLSADAAISLLQERAGEAKAAGERQRDLRQALATAEAAGERASQAVAEASERLATLMPDGGDGAAIATRLQERERLRMRLAESRARLALQAEGRAETDIRAALEGFDRVAAGLDIERLEADDNAALEQFGDLNVRLADLRREREALEQGVGAERAALERLSAEVEAKDLARQWVVLKLAAGLLNATMDSYREKQADPVMRRAGDLFSEITGGRFRRLVQLYDESDALQLLAEREGGEQVPLTGLSEGTGDQLYLALRLAFIEDFARRNEPVPLIADDIFQTFDEERTAAGLLTLADTGKSFQTILFTHQKSVADAAKRLLGDRADVVAFGAA
ncbi:MAG: chromosome segregation protein SMC [Shinella sp.]|nr:MAG: chromosome segregation protein SMC [Shinella sp.]